MSSNGSNSKNSWGDSGSWVTGLMVGLAIGISLGVAMGNIGAGIAIGMGIGVAFGVAFSQSKKSQEPQRSGDNDEPGR
jgi:predicted lipid-binding transport protein (Tim44 family)